jgi:hypothetical protein
MSIPKRQRQPGQLFCAFVMFLLGVMYGSDALRAQRKQGPFHIWHYGYLVTDSPRVGLVLSIFFIALSAYLVAWFILAKDRNHGP